MRGMIVAKKTTSVELLFSLMKSFHIDVKINEPFESLQDENFSELNPVEILIFSYDCLDSPYLSQIRMLYQSLDERIRPLFGVIGSGSSSNLAGLQVDLQIELPLQASVVSSNLRQLIESRNVSKRHSEIQLSDAVIEPMLQLKDEHGHPLIGKLVTLFEKNSASIVSGLQDAVRSSQNEVALNLLHKLRGMSANLGIESLAKRCGELESEWASLSSHSKASACRKIIDECSVSLSCLKLHVKNHLELAEVSV